MSETVIKVENLYKEYRLGAIGYGTFREDLQSWWARIRGKEDPNSLIVSKHDNESDKKHLLALNDISFDVKRGEIVGIIGRNGAGKSTMLKILSRITSPSQGRVKIKGRIGSLLEVGVGFHPELTGRDNVYLNGSILGMKRKEIDRKFDEIVDFSGVERFIDTPVKRYSSGMYVRLAFSVAAHLEPEILIVDEVLAVGDLEFQKKCLGKMGDISNEGRTVLFVSHNMVAVKILCNRCILLSHGQLVHDDTTEETLLKYSELLRLSKLKNNKDGEYSRTRRGSGTISFTDVKMINEKGQEQNEFYVNDMVRFRLSYEIYEKIKGLSMAIAFLNPMNKEIIMEVRHPILEGEVENGKKGTAVLEIKLDKIRPGEYPLYFWLGDEDANYANNPTHYDVIDDETIPLIIRKQDDDKALYGGHFTLSSSVIERV